MRQARHSTKICQINIKQLVWNRRDYSTLGCDSLCHMNAAPLPVHTSLYQSNIHQLPWLNLSAVSIVTTALDKLQACKNTCIVRNKSETFISLWSIPDSSRRSCQLQENCNLQHLLPINWHKSCWEACRFECTTGAIIPWLVWWCRTKEEKFLTSRSFQSVGVRGHRAHNPKSSKQNRIPGLSCPRHGIVSGPLCVSNLNRESRLTLSIRARANRDWQRSPQPHRNTNLIIVDQLLFGLHDQEVVDGCIMYQKSQIAHQHSH